MRKGRKVVEREGRKRRSKKRSGGGRGGREENEEKGKRKREEEEEEGHVTESFDCRRCAIFTMPFAVNHRAGTDGRGKEEVDEEKEGEKRRRGGEEEEEEMRRKAQDYSTYSVDCHSSLIFTAPFAVGCQSDILMVTGING